MIKPLVINGENCYDIRCLLVSSNYVILLLCISLIIQYDTNINYNGDLIIYFFSIFIYFILAVANHEQRVVSEIIKFIIMLGLIQVIYLQTPNMFAFPLYYLFTLKNSLVLSRKWALVTGGIIAGTFVLVNISNITLDYYNILWLAMHAFLMLNVGLLAQQLAYMERKERKQNNKIEQMLTDMEHSYRIAENMASKDALTGLYNYRSFRNRVSDLEIENISILLLDIDFFKVFNDSYGHLCGDVILREISAILSQSVRGDDMVFRYGGEEFVVIMNDISSRKLEIVALRILRNISRHKVTFEEKEIENITVSIGYAIGSQYNDAEELFKAADDALYIVKNNGRNGACQLGGKILRIA